MLLEVINGVNDIFGSRHSWLSPITSEQGRKQFISRRCDWWNNLVCLSVDRTGALWNEQRQRFEIAAETESPASIATS